MKKLNVKLFIFYHGKLIKKDKLLVKYNLQEQIKHIIQYQLIKEWLALMLNSLKLVNKI